MANVYLGLGSNLGDKKEQLITTTALLAERVGDVLEVSCFYETSPWGFQSEYMFLNRVVQVDTSLSPFALLAATQQIEYEMGRTAKSNEQQGTSKNPTRHAELVSASPLYQGIADHVRNDDCAKSVVFRSPQQYTDRTMDIDILLYDELILQSPTLILPHPLMHKRIFVLQPLSEIAPDLNHPILNKKITELYQDLMREKLLISEK